MKIDTGTEDLLGRIDGHVAVLSFNRPERRNALSSPMYGAFDRVLPQIERDPSVRVLLLTGEGGAFCAGGDQRVRGTAGYVDQGGVPRLNVLDLQMLIRRLPKPVVAMVAGYAIGGGHVLHVVCDLTIASSEHALFKQTDADVGSFDGGYGSAYLARQVGQKFAREVFSSSRRNR